MPLFEELTSPQLGEYIRLGALVLIPVGQTEEHGDHLPISTDTRIAESIAQAAAERLQADLPILLTRAIWAGYSGVELSHWPGTIRVRTRVLVDYVHDIILSLTEMGLEKIVTINGHGHHPALLETVAREIADETGVYIACVDVARMAAQAVTEGRQSLPGGCIHGGEFETSLMLHLGAGVDMAKAHDTDTFRYHSRNFPGDGFSGSKAAFWSTWGVQRSETGIYGDPTAANAEFGRRVFDAAVENLCDFLLEYHSMPAVDWD